MPKIKSTPKPIKRKFSGIFITKAILVDPLLDTHEILILGIINALDLTFDGCFASNSHLAKLTRMSTSTVSRKIAYLKKIDAVFEIGFDGRKRHLKVCSRYKHSKSKHRAEDDDELDLDI